MEFTPNLSTFQGVIISADNVHSFSKLTARGGNEGKIEYIISRMKTFLEKGNYIVENNISEHAVPDMRKFAFYVILNSDLAVLEELVDLDGIDFVIWTIPTISKCLMCEILWNLHFDKFIHEILVFSCPKLALEVADALIEHFKYMNPTECLQKLHLLTSACYKLMYRFFFFKLEGNELTQAMTNFQKCLKYFSEPPNSSKLEVLNKDEQYKFIGKRLYSMLLLLSDCFSTYTNVQKLKPTDFQQIYELTYKEDTVINKEASIIISDSNNQSLQECISNCHILLLDKCKHLVMDVSVEIFCAWSEFDDNNKSMQQTIGELCHKVHTELSRISSVLDHPVMSMLQQISCKPMDLVEVINKTDASVIVENVTKEDNASQWIKALIYRDNLCDDLVLLDLVGNHLGLLNEDEHLKLFKIIYNYLKTSENNNNLLLMAIKIFQLCSNSFKLGIVEEHFNNDCFNDSLLTTEFNHMKTEIFNKLIISPDTDLCNVLTVFIQSPKKVLTYIFNLASENTQQTDIMLRIMKLLKVYSKHYYDKETEASLILITKEIINNNLDSNEKKCNFIRFLTLLKAENVIPGNSLILQVIMPELHQALINKNFIIIYVHSRLLQEAYVVNELLEYRAPILAMLAQILDKVRWKINTFVAIGPHILDLVLQLQTELINSYESDIPERELIWLRSKLKNIHPLNMYYYKCLWNPPGNTFVEVISGIHIHKDMDMENLTLWLSQVICSTTAQEWYQIWDSLVVFGDGKILDTFHNALLLILVAEKSKHTEYSIACLFYCITNLVSSIRYKFLKLPLNEIQITTVFNKFAILENMMSENDVEQLSTIFLPLFAFISAMKEDLPESIPLGLLSKLKHKIFIDMINNLFIKARQIKT